MSVRQFKRTCFSADGFSITAKGHTKDRIHDDILHRQPLLELFYLFQHWNLQVFALLQQPFIYVLLPGLGNEDGWPVVEVMQVTSSDEPVSALSCQLCHCAFGPNCGRLSSGTRLQEIAPDCQDRSRPKLVDAYAQGKIGRELGHMRDPRAP